VGTVATPATAQKIVSVKGGLWKASVMKSWHVNVLHERPEEPLLIKTPRVKQQLLPVNLGVFAMTLMVVHTYSIVRLIRPYM
jgi:hypothetical protein